MPSGVAPAFPETGWKVLFQDALTAWLAGGPGLTDVTEVMAWIQSCKLLGPSATSRDGELTSAVIPRTSVLARYLVVDHEFMVIVKNFT